jgi:predicted dehydrogenase
LLTKYYLGQNLLTVHASHTLDTLTYILGSEFSTLSGFTSIRSPQVQIIAGGAYSAMNADPNAKPEVLRTVTRNSPDQLLINGTLKSNVPVSAHIWVESPPTKSHFYWRISGTKGYLEFRGDYAVFLGQQGPRLFMSDDGEEPKEVQVGDEKQGNYLVPLYERFAKDEGGYPRFEDAIVRHRMVEAVWESGRRIAERVEYDTTLP